MFSYYGSKRKIAHLYPTPQHLTIVEPFAGAAHYSLFHAKYNPGKYRVILFEKSVDTFLCWKWLQSVSVDELVSLPIPEAKQPIPQFSDRGKSVFLSFTMNQGTAKPRKSAGGMKGCAVANVKRRLERTAALLPVIRDWQVYNTSYTSAPNDLVGTWYVDPPYFQEKWGEYAHGPEQINYSVLADWCKSRLGQVIVAENDNAPWLPFKPLVVCAGQRKTSTLRNEGIWTNEVASWKPALEAESDMERDRR